MKKIVILASTLLVTSAFAWGPREQGALLGLAIGAGVASTMQSNQVQAAPVFVPQYSPPPTVIYTPTPQICGYNVQCAPTQCWEDPVRDQWGNIIGARRTCK